MHSKKLDSNWLTTIAWLLTVSCAVSAQTIVQGPGNRCARNEPVSATVLRPTGGSPLGTNAPPPVNSAEDCAKACIANPQCTISSFNELDKTSGKGCILYPASVTSRAPIQPGQQITLSTIQPCPTTAAAATTVAATTAAATTAAAVATTAATTAAPTVTTTGKPTDKNPKCCEWAKKGECDLNPFYVRVECKIACGTPTATVENADKIASNNSPECESTLNTGVGGCQNHDSQCYRWALDGECDKNPFFIRVKCNLACRVCGKNGPANLNIVNACGDVAVSQSCPNNHLRCNFWATIGECQRNADYMVTTCCAACSQLQSVLLKNCPLSTNAPFDGIG